MKLFEIKRIIEEMVTDVKLEISLLSGKYDFEPNKDYAELAFLHYRRKEKLLAIDIDLLPVSKIVEIEKYFTDLGKIDYFTIAEIDDFLHFITKGD